MALSTWLVATLPELQAAPGTASGRFFVAALEDQSSPYQAADDAGSGGLGKAALARDIGTRQFFVVAKKLQNDRAIGPADVSQPEDRPAHRSAF